MLDSSQLFSIALLIFAVVFAMKTVRIVPQQEIWILERLGKSIRAMLL